MFRAIVIFITWNKVYGSSPLCVSCSVNIQMDTLFLSFSLISYLYMHNTFNFSFLKENIKIISNTSEWFLSFFKHFSAVFREWNLNILLVKNICLFVTWCFQPHCGWIWDKFFLFFSWTCCPIKTCKDKQRRKKLIIASRQIVISGF